MFASARTNNLDIVSQYLSFKHKLLLRDFEILASYHSKIVIFIENEHEENVNDFDPGNHDRSYHVKQIRKTNDGLFFMSSDLTSFSTHLFSALNLKQNLVKLLLDVRLHAVAVSANIIKRMSGSILRKAERHIFQFLWQASNDEKTRCYQMCKATPSEFLRTAAAGSLQVVSRFDCSVYNGRRDD